MIDGKPVPAIYGIGDSLIYFIDGYTADDKYERMGFKNMATPEGAGQGVHRHRPPDQQRANGTMQTWATFYKSVFGFEEVRYFDIRGAQTA